MAGDEKIICPSCDKETVKGEKCSLCGFLLDGFDNFCSWSDAAEKRRNKKAAEAKAAADADATKNQPKKTFFSHLGGK